MSRENSEKGDWRDQKSAGDGFLTCQNRKECSGMSNTAEKSNKIKT